MTDRLVVLAPGHVPEDRRLASTPVETEISDRHREVLREAMRLVAERGFKGASLRELARRVGMQQPSLYHYFRSKDELVEQILEHMGLVFDAEAQLPPPERLDAVPFMLAHGVVELYQRTDWGLFVRFIFAISSSESRWRPRLRELFVDRGATAIRTFMQPFIQRGEIGADQADLAARMIMNAVGLLMIEQQILYPGERDLPDPHLFADFVARVAAAGIGSLPRPEHATD